MIGAFASFMIFGKLLVIESYDAASSMDSAQASNE